MLRFTAGGGAAIACAVAALGAVGCVGDDTNPAVPSDAGGTDATASDAGSDAPGPDSTPPDSGPPLGCTTWRYASPVVLEDLSAGDGHFAGALWVGEVASGQLRVLASTGKGPAFRLYALDKSADAGAVTTLDGPNDIAWVFQDARHFELGSAGVTQVLIQRDAADGGDVPNLAAYLLPDGLPVSGPLPSPITLGAGGASVVAEPFDTSRVFAAVRYPYSVGLTNYYGLGVELGTATKPGAVTNVSVSPQAADFNFLGMAHVGSDVHVFASNAASITGVSVWTVPDTAAAPPPPPPDAGAPNPRTFDTGTQGRMIDIAPAKSAGATNIAYYAGALDGASGSLRVGQLTDVQLPTATAADIFKLRDYPDRTLDAVLSRAEWWGDDLMLIGPGLGEPDGGPFPGLDVLWFDATGHVHGEQWGANAVLRDRVIRKASAAPASAGATSGRWDVAWIEARGGGEALLYNELVCH